MGDYRLEEKNRRSWWPGFKILDRYITRKFLGTFFFAIALIIIIGRTTTFVIEHIAENSRVVLIMAGVSLVICLAQFGIGRWLGRRYGDATAGGQSLGQKNTVLAIWMAQSFLNPLSSVAPTAYILWQNAVNSWQMYRYEKKNRN